MVFFKGEDNLERSLSSRSLSPTKTQSSFSPLPKSPSLDEVSDYKDVKIKELEETIKVLMAKLEACTENKEVNGVENSCDENNALQESA